MIGEGPFMSKKKPMPMNRGDLGYVGLHFAAQIALSVANMFEQFATFAAINSTHIDNRKRVKEQRAELEDSVMYDLSHLEVTDG